MSGFTETLTAQYAKERAEAHEKAEFILIKAEKNAEFKNAENGLKALYGRLAFAEVSGDDALLFSLNAEKELLLKKRESALKSLNMTENDFLPQYKCKICGDTGFISAEACLCYKRRLSEIILKSLNLPQTDLSVKPDKKINAGIYKFIDEYIAKFDVSKIKNLILAGKAGTGKTYIAKYAAGSLKQKGRHVIYLSAFYLNNLFLKYHNAFERERYLYIDILLNCELLVIDDLGTEPIYKNVTAEYLLGLISERLNASKHTIITTNLSHSDIISRYGERLFSRLNEKSKIRFINIDTKDLRL